MEREMVYLVVNEGEILFAAQDYEEAEGFVQSLRDAQAGQAAEKLDCSATKDDFAKACFEAGYEAEGCVIYPQTLFEKEIGGLDNRTEMDLDWDEMAQMLEQYAFDWDEE